MFARTSGITGEVGEVNVPPNGHLAIDLILELLLCVPTMGRSDDKPVLELRSGEEQLKMTDGDEIRVASGLILDPAESVAVLVAVPVFQ